MHFKLKHGVKSYEVIHTLLNHVFPQRYDLVMLDLTFGVGRFYRLVRNKIKKLIGVDIIKHNWEIKPDLFIQEDCIRLVHDILSGRFTIEKPDVIVVDPPWSIEKRGVTPKYTGTSNMPYHMNTSSARIIHAAIKLASHYKSHLLYRYKEPLSCNHVVRVDVETKIMHHEGFVYYGVCVF